MKNFSKEYVIQNQPAHSSQMDMESDALPKSIIKSEALTGKVAIITGGDSDIGRAVAYLYAQQNMNIVIIYYDEDDDAQQTAQQIKDFGGNCLPIKGDIRDKNFCKNVVDLTIKEFGRIDVLVNNAAVQYSQDTILEITSEQLIQTFEVNVFGLIYMTQAVLPHLKSGGNIINTASITAFKGNDCSIWRAWST